MNWKNKTICGWHRTEIKRKNLLTVIEPQVYFCTECGRIANKKKWLCEPKRIHKKID